MLGKARSAGCLALALILSGSLPGSREGQARALQDIQVRGVISLCAHPNALPLASKNGQHSGYQIELARELAKRLGVRLEVEWVTVGFQLGSADCDLVMDTITDPEAQLARNLRWSTPYQRSGVALAVPKDADSIASFSDLDVRHRVGVQLGSLAHMYLQTRGVQTIPFGYEDEMVEAVANREIDAAAVTPLSVGYYNHTHPDKPLKLVHAYEGVPELSWDLAVGMRRSDRFLRKAVDGAVESMLEDGTFDRIYSSYGIEHRLPEGRQLRKIERTKPLEEGECVRLGRSRECAPSR